MTRVYLVRTALAALSLTLASACPTVAKEPADRPTDQAGVTVLSPMDYIQIHELYARFATGVDHGDGKAIAATMTEDGTFTGGRRAGSEPLPRKPNVVGREGFLKMGENTGNGTRHFMTNIILTPTKEGVDGMANLLLFESSVYPPTIIQTAVYTDKIVWTDGGWRFKSRVVWRDDDDYTPFKFKPKKSPPGAYNRSSAPQPEPVATTPAQ